MQLILGVLTLVTGLWDTTHGFTGQHAFSSNICPPPPPCGDLPPGCHYAPDSSGCQSCNLVCPGPMDCMPHRCEIFCQYGNIVDENGCQLCGCNQPPNFEKQKTETPHQFQNKKPGRN